MRSLTECVQEVYLDNVGEPEAEDIFASAAGALWTDDLVVSHGSDFSLTVYENDAIPDIRLRMTKPGIHDASTRLFAHHLWNASILMSEKLTGKRLDTNEHGRWRVKGATVLELGAGAGLTSIVASHVGARRVAMTDYPTESNLQTMHGNVVVNVPEAQKGSISTHGHKWGEFEDNFAKRNKHEFTRILAADLYWMPDTHELLIRSMLHFLSEDPDAVIYVIGGFHTGRDKLAHFFDMATEFGLQIEDIFEEFHTGERRAWQANPRSDEGVVNRKFWLVVAILTRKSNLD